jgi:polysaccharide biosynthesis/export protein
MLMSCTWLLAGVQAVSPPGSLSSSHAPAAATLGADPRGAVPSDYRIGPGDILRVTVYGHDDLSQTVVVQPGGGFVYPLIGAVDAAEIAPEELAVRIAARLAKGLIRDPRVTVAVQEYRSKVVYVMGEIARPGPYPLTGRTTVVEVLAKAGPLSAQAGSEVVVVRPVGGGEGRPLLPSEAAPTAAQVLKVDVAAIQAGRLDRNLLLAPNDTVFVPQAERIFVTGEVRNPGAFAFHAGLTMRQAVSLAGGFSDDAATGSGRVVRSIDGKTHTLKLKLDDPLRPGDTVLIKGKLF